MAIQTVFHGSEREAQELVNAVARNCCCKVNDAGIQTETCAAHRMMLDDQRALDGLLVSRRRRDQLNHQEHDRFDSSGIWVQG